MKFRINVKTPNKKLINGIIATGLPVAMLIMSSCGGALKETETAEETTAEIEAAQMEGRSAARVFVNREWKDTMRLHEKLLEARAVKSAYELAGKKKCAETFDSAFISTLRSVRPDMAKEIMLRGAE